MGWGIWPREEKPQRCVYCRKLVDKGDKFYYELGKPVHALCIWEQIDMEREGVKWVKK